MKKFISNIMAGLVLVSAPALVSCGSDYLNTTPTESVLADDAVATAENGYKALNGIAKTMSAQQAAWDSGCAGENRIIALYENYASQDYFYNYYAQGWAPIMNLQYSLRNNTSYDAYPWYYYYTLVSQANAIIAHIDEADGNEGLKKFDKASALTFRAYGFEKLLHYYAPRWQDSNNGTAKGICLRLDESTGELPQSTMAECYAQIYNDLDEAIALFQQSGKNRGSKEIWIANENVAHAVYARAALAKQDYQTALTHAPLARKGYSLMSNADYYAGFCKPTSEWIFGSYGGSQENMWYWSFGTQYACNGYYANNTACGAGSIDIELTNLIPDNDVRKGLFLTPDKFENFDLNDKTVADNYYLGYGIMGFSNDALWDEVDAWVENRHNSSAASSMDRPYQPGYYYVGGQTKFYVFDTPGVGYLPFIRSSEMVLIEAEANYFLGNEAAAQAALVELNASTGRDANYTCEKTGEELFDEIVNYRRLELWGEGFGFSDYKRWNKEISRKALSKGGSASVAIAVTVKPSDPNWTWAIPQWETDYNDAFRDPTKDEK
ncbi:RagB/SusD family nutrient uptake outer membrane protein [Xylanibacter ruminicola]|nr:RagB/SusD family nutrient uptake outer membrane protein [Xylanibacter ruminicola]